MPSFGDFETVGEPIAVTEYRHHTTTVWRASKRGSGADPTFTVKCFVPHRSGSAAAQDEEKLDKDRALEFLEGVKQLKKAHAEGGRSLCPVHAFGFADDGPWYATDFYPRNTLKAWIARRGSMDSAALAQVVRCVSTAALALKRSRGYSHGNLKPSNIFLVGKPRPLRQTPLELGDIYPTGAAPMARLDDEANREAKELLGSVMEVQDLRALGELLLQLVEGRLVSSAYDYNYPIAASPAWERLGRAADRWRELCNRLLDPQLSLTKINFESLAKEFQPSVVAAKLPMIAGAIGVLILIAGGAVYFAARPRLPTTAAPVSNPTGGKFTESVSVVLNTPTANAAIHYTLDGSEPTTNSSRYTMALVFTETSTVRAKAFAPDQKPSKTVKETYEVNPAAVVAQPTFSPGPGDYKDSVILTLASATPGATIHYTTDGREPTSQSPRYTRPFTLTATTIVKAKAVADKYKDSPTASATFSVSQTLVVMAPTISPAPGDYKDLVTVSLANDTAGATIHYTTNDTDPTERAPRYFAPFTLTNSATVKARAFAPGQKESAITSAKFAVTRVAVPPTIKPDLRNHRDAVTVELSTPTSGATIYYTTDGREPNSQSPRYVRPFTLTDTTVVKAKAVADNFQESPTASATFNVVTTQVASAPTITPTAGEFQDSVTVTLASATVGATIRYTINNADPTANAPRYVAPITLTNSVTLKARAFAPDQRDSAITSAEFVVTTKPVTVIPTIKPNGGNHRDLVTVELSTPTPGATIYYTTDGGEPTTDSRRYTRAFTLTNTTSVKAKAVVSNFKDSPTASATFNIAATQFAIAPTISPAGGEHMDEVMVTLSSRTPGATIYYTTNGSEPTAAATLYRAPFKLTQTTTVSARTLATNYEPSQTVRAEFKVTAKLQVALPVIKPEKRDQVDAVTVTIESSTPGAKIYYTTDDREPTVRSALYTQPIALTNTTTVRARAVANNYTDSAVASAKFNVSFMPATVMPAITPNGGTYADAVEVTLRCATPGATIYFTTDGSDPTTNSARYQKNFPLTQTATVMAWAWAEGCKPSAPARASFNVTNTPLLAIAPARMEVIAGQSIRLKLAGTGPKDAPLNYKVQTPPAKGKVSEPNGSVLDYTAAETTEGEDSFTFVVTDGRRESAPAKVVVRIISKLEQPLSAARQSLATNSLVAAQKFLREASELNPGSEAVRALAGDLKNKVVEVVAAVEKQRQKPDYAAALGLCEKQKGLKELDDLAIQLRSEQTLWKTASEQFADGKYDYVAQLSEASLSEKPPFNDLFTRGQTEKNQLAALLQAQGGTNAWQRVRDGLKELPAAVQKKSPFRELNQWVTNNDPANQLQVQLNAYKVLFGVGNYKDLSEFKNKAFKPLPKARVDRAWLDEQFRTVQALENEFKKYGQLESRKDDLNNLKDVITRWND